jgi:hypothetical protein
MGVEVGVDIRPFEVGVGAAARVAAEVGVGV